MLNNDNKRKKGQKSDSSVQSLSLCCNVVVRDRNTKLQNPNLHTFLSNLIYSKVATMLGTTLDKEEVEEFMREADVVIKGIYRRKKIFHLYFFPRMEMVIKGIYRRKKIFHLYFFPR